MSKTAKIWLIVAASFIVAGLIIFGGAMTMIGWDFGKLSTGKFETNSYVIAESYTDITIATDTAGIVFVPSENEKTSVVCYEESTARHSVDVIDDVLTIKVTNTKKWYQYIGLSFGTPKITVYLPSSEYGSLSIKESTGAVDIPNSFVFEGIDITASTGAVKSSASASGYVKIKTSTGAIDVAGMSAASLDLSVSTGRVTLSNVSCSGDISVKVSTGKATLTKVTCQNLVSNGSTGSVILNKVISNGKFNIERSTGDIKLFDCDAAELFIKTDTGDVSGTLLTPKIFSAKTDTGKIDVPKSTSGGLCEVITDTGDIRISIAK